MWGPGFCGPSQNQGKSFDEVESNLQSEYGEQRGKSRLGWDKAKDASRAAWDRVQGASGENTRDRH